MSRTLSRVAILCVIALLAACGEKTDKDTSMDSDTPSSTATKDATDGKTSTVGKPSPKQPEDASTPGDVAPSDLPDSNPDGQQETASGEHPGLRDPKKAQDRAPDTFKVKLTTTKGDVVIELTRDWAPRGVDQFYNLVQVGYFTDVAFFRVVDGFMAQFGMHGDPAINAAWSASTIKDEPVVKSNRRGFVTFAKTQLPNSRSTQLFINYGDNAGLDAMGFAPIGQIVEGIDVVDALHSGYGDGPPRGQGPDQSKMTTAGNTYLKAGFPKLDYVKSAQVVR